MEMLTMVTMTTMLTTTTTIPMSATMTTTMRKTTKTDGEAHDVFYFEQACLPIIRLELLRPTLQPTTTAS